MNYDDIPFDTGDILLFHGATSGGNCLSNLLSGAIEKCTRSNYSHAGIVIKDPTFTPEPLKGLYILESTGFEDVKDVEDHQVKFGVQLRELEEVVKNYDGKVFWRQLHCYRSPRFYQKLAVAHNIVHNRPYDDGFDYVKALFNWHIGDCQKEKTFFCSALVAFVYVVWGFLPRDTAWSIVTPAQLSSEKNQLFKMVWQECTLNPVVKIKVS